MVELRNPVNVDADPKLSERRSAFLRTFLDALKLSPHQEQGGRAFWMDRFGKSNELAVGAAEPAPEGRAWTITINARPLERKIKIVWEGAAAKREGEFGGESAYCLDWRPQFVVEEAELDVLAQWLAEAVAVRGTPGEVTIPDLFRSDTMKDWRPSFSDRFKRPGQMDLHSPAGWRAWHKGWPF